ncbi:hypothetical protein [uncultured Tessaracoccus sp.]|uniref:hypothetical protein n=1 Tax=uncultured Tessaracoccus sp. TaxID=905023 RepID=UPI002611347C|nr:hypothetical protein [uncultured Tessaracoccus sp.]
MTSGSDYVILAARRPLAVLLSAMLQDLTVQGLVNTCRIVDLDALRDDHAAVPVKVLRPDGVAGAALQQDLANVDVTRLRVAVVGDVDDEECVVSQEQAVRVLEALQSTMPGAPITQLSVSAGSPDSQWQRRSLVLYGWHNLVISPEESRAPGRASSPLRSSTRDPKWAMLLCGTLTSLLGLWPGQAAGPFDDRQPPSGQLVVPIRGFSRSLSSGSVQHALGERLVSVAERYPAPHTSSGHVVTVDDEASRVVGMAERLFELHPDTMPRVRHASPPPRPRDIGVGAALKEFFQFLGSALSGAPGRLMRAVDQAASRAVASTVQNAVFGGSDSGYAVVVRGVRADGSSSSWAEYEQSLESVIRRSTRTSGDLPPVLQNPKLWRDFVGGGFSLLDAGQHAQGLDPFTSGSQPAIVPTTDRVAHDPRDTFTLPASLAAFLPNWEIEPGDDIAVSRLFERLDHLSRTQPHLSQAITTQKNRLREWAEDARNSYAGHVGRRLADAHRATIREVDELTEKVNHLSAQPEIVDDSAELQDNLAMQVRVLTGVSGSIIAILVALTALQVFAWPWLLVGIVMTFLGWMSSGAVLLTRSKAKEYALLNHLEQRQTALDDAIRHRMEALEDLRKISRSYRQYLDWSRVLGAFLHAPHGHPSEASERDVHVGQGMPLNIAIGVAVPDRDAIDDVANAWRGALFATGWLSEPWMEFQRELPASLGSFRMQLANDPALLESDPTIDGMPILTRWSRAMAAHAATRTVSASFQSKIVHETLRDTNARNRLLSRVIVRESHSGQASEVHRDEFMAGLDQDGQQRDSFQHGLFAAETSVLDIRSVTDTIRQDQSNGLDKALVVIQTGRAIPISQLAGEPVDAAGISTIEHSGDFV